MAVSDLLQLDNVTAYFLALQAMIGYHSVKSACSNGIRHHSRKLHLYGKVPEGCTDEAQLFELIWQASEDLSNWTLGATAVLSSRHT